MPDSDTSLLQSFAATRCEKAFRQLVDRYAGLIFHTAFRRTGNRALAEEASQNVLCALARKAHSLARHPDRLAPWLHRATVYESLKAMRSETAHQRRKELRHPDETSSHPIDPQWSEAIPILDASLDKLSETDRTVLLLHFYEQRSFPQIARTLGRSAEAVQKQSRRALEKLARILRGKGIALSVTGIATGLSAEFAKAAPVSFTATATGHALISPASNPTLISMIASKPKYLAPIVLLICAIPLIIQQNAISQAESRNTKLLSGLEISPIHLDLASNKRIRPTDPSSGGTAHPDFADLARQWDETRRTLGGSRNNLREYPDLDRYYQALEALDNETLIQLIHDGIAAEIDQAKKYPAIRTILNVLAERDPRLALDTAIDAFPSGADFLTAVEAAGIGPILGEWAAKDPVAAWKWFSENRHTGKISSISETQAPSGNRSPFGNLNLFLRPLANSLILSNLPLASELMETIPMGGRGDFLTTLHAGIIMDSISSRKGPAIISSETALHHSLSILALTREFAPMSMEKVLPAILNEATSGFGNPTAIDSFFERAQLNEDEKIIAAHHYARSSQNRNSGILPSSFSDDDGKRYTDQVDLIRELAPALSEQLIADARAEKQKSNALLAKAQIEKLQSSGNISDEQLIQILSRYDFSSQIDAAIQQAERIKDPEKRSQVIEQIRRNP